MYSLLYHVKVHFVCTAVQHVAKTQLQSKSCLTAQHVAHIYIAIMLLASTSVVHTYVPGMILCVAFRELLRRGTEVVLVGNTLPAINDITVSELVSVLEDVAQFCPVIKASSLSLGQWASGPVHKQDCLGMKPAECIPAECGFSAPADAHL